MRVIFIFSGLFLLFNTIKSEQFAYMNLPSKYGFINSKGIISITPIYDDVKNFSEGYAPAAINDEEDMVKLGQNQAYVFVEGSQLSGEQNQPLYRKWGYIDKKGEWVIKPIFVSAESFSDGYAAVAILKKENNNDILWGFINKSGDYTVEPQYHSVLSYSEGLAAVEIIDKGKTLFGYIDKNGKWIISPQYDKATSFSSGLALVWKSDWFGFIDKLGQVVYSFSTWKTAYPFSDGVALVGLNNGKAIYINNKCKTLFSVNQKLLSRVDGRKIQFHKNRFSEGVAMIKDGDILKYVNKKGSIMVSGNYDWGNPYSEGLALVIWDYKFNSKRKNDTLTEATYFYLDRLGRVVLEIDYDYIKYYSYSSNTSNPTIKQVYGFDTYQFLHSGDFTEGLAPIRVIKRDL